MDDPIASHEQRLDAGTPGWKRRLGLALFGWLSAWLLRILGSTWRVRVRGPDPRALGGDGTPGSRLAALYHESMLPAVWLFRDQGHGVAVSRSHDGDLVSAALLELGYAEPARGSSSRGGPAVLRRMVRQIRQGLTVAVLVDGPRGPARVSKTGVLALARLTGQAVVPLAFSARPAWRLRSWDTSLIPLPFARIVCVFGEPLPVARCLGESEQKSLVVELDRRLHALHRVADQELGRSDATRDD